MMIRNSKAPLLLVCLLATVGNAVTSKAAIPTPKKGIENLEELYPFVPPQIRISIPPQLESCLKDTANPTGVLTQPSQWSLTCDISVLLKRAEYLRIKPPSLRLLMGRLVHAEIIRIRQTLVDHSPGEVNGTPLLDSEKTIKAADKPLLSAPGLSQALNSSNPNAASHVSTVTDPTTQLIDNKKTVWTEILKKVTLPTESARNVSTAAKSEAESVFIKSTEQLVKSAQSWLRPLYADSKHNNSILAFEGAYEFALLLGDSLRFAPLKNLLKEKSALLTNHRTLQGEFMKKVIVWAETYGNAGLKEWALDKTIQLRNGEVKGSGTLELYYWLKSFELGGLPADKYSHDFMLRKFRELAISYPTPSDQNEISRVAKVLALDGEYKLPIAKEMTVGELLTRAKAQIKFLDTLGALRTMRHVRQLPPEATTQDDLWEALQFQVKVLRLLDERPQIPAVIANYLAVGGFLSNPPSEKGALQKFLNRAQEIARMYWNYDSQDKALAVIQKIEEINAKNKTDYSLGPALVIKARISEQSKDSERERAIALIDQALNTRISQDLMIDLMWRKIFLQIDLSRLSGNFESAFPYFEPLKKFSDKDTFEKARWNYWMAKIHLMQKSPEKALPYLQASYSAEPNSYYSDLAGLELIQLKATPKDWLLGPKNETVNYERRRWKQPNYELYFNESGHPREAIYKSLSRVYQLAIIGDLRSAENAYAELDRDLWARVLSSKIPWPKRHEFVRTVAYLRLALGDPMGALRAADVARQSNPKSIDLEDYLNLYPLPFWNSISEEAKKRNINPWLVASLIRQESAFNPRARSWANAIGLMQMIPPVAEAEAKELGWYSFDVESLYDPSIAVLVGSQHLSRLLTNFEKSWICSIAAYNAGSPPVLKWIQFYNNDLPLTFVERIPFVETRNYVKSILRNYINYHRIYGVNEISLDDFLKLPKGVPGTAVAKSPKE